MVRVSQCPYCNKKYRSSTWYRNHIEKQHPDFVPPPQAVQQTVGERVQPPNPFPEANETHELHNSIEIQIADYEPESDHSIADSYVESLNLFEREDRLTDFVESRAPTKHHTAGRVLRDAVQRQKAEDELWAPFQNNTDFELAQWFIEAKVPNEHIDRYFKNGLGPENSTIKSAYRLFHTVDELELGLGMRSWKKGLVSFTELDIEDADRLELATSQRRFFYRNPLDCVKYLLCQKCSAQDIVYAPVKDWDSETPPARVYSEMHVGDWWWETQDSLLEGATLVPIICSSDVTFLTNFSGDKKPWPIYSTIGNILSKTRNKSSKHASVLLALSPGPPEMLGVTSRESRQRLVNNEILCELIEAIFTPIGEVPEVGIEIECADGKVRQCFPHLAACIADHLENVTWHGIQQNQCAVCETTPDRLGSYTGRSATIRDYKEYQTLFAENSNGSSDAREDVINRGFKLRPSVFWGLPDVHQAHLPKPDILHVVYLGIFETHLLKWIIGYLKKYKRLQAFDVIWKNLPAYPGYSPPNNEYSRVLQWTGKEMRNLHNTKVIPRRQIQYLERYLKAFHDHKDVFDEYRKDKSPARKVWEVTAWIRSTNHEVLKQHRLSGLTVTERRRIADKQRQELEGVEADIYDEDVDFNIVKIHLLSHFVDHIRRFGNIQMYSTESGETSHKIMIKEGYRRSNKNDTSYQILGTYARLDSFKIHEMNVIANNIHPQCDEPESEQVQRRIGSSVKQQQGHGLSIKTVTQLDKTLKYLPRLLVDYYWKKSFGERIFGEDLIEKFPIEICRLLRVPVRNFQDPSKITWHLLHCTGRQLWKSTGWSRNDWIWVDSCNEDIYGALKGLYPARLVSIFKVREQITGSIDWLVLAERLYVENSGMISDLTGLVTVTLGTARRPHVSTRIVGWRI
ncbi:hypothetical protein HOY80DRAFT_1075254 [Tuber brumale]|nr:hypothetical protein HOY80DRAFT_1075254 [Tuber brumale]